MSQYRAVAESILGDLKKQYGKPNLPVVVKEADYAHLDLDAYRDFRQTMEREGYRFLADVGYPTAVVGLNHPGMIRSMVSADGTTMASYYQLRPRIGRLLLNLIGGILALRFIAAPRFFAKMRTTKHYYDFESEVGETHLGTSNAADAGAFSRPATLDLQFHPYTTSREDVAAAHAARLNALRRAKPATVISTVEDGMALQERLVQRKNAHRVAIGWITKKELAAMASSDNQMLVDGVWAEIQQILAEDAAKQPK